MNATEREHTHEQAAVEAARRVEDDACGECGGRGWVLNKSTPKAFKSHGRRVIACPECRAAEGMPRGTR
jgi:hypothetical protein